MIKNLTLITSSICNLDCSYCFLHKNNAYKEYNKNIYESFQNGSYLKNVLKTFELMQWNRDNVDSISFWGGESLTYINILQQQLPIIFKSFPNINTMLLSTNFSINIEKFVNFLIELDKNIKHPITVRLQLSIDGPNNTLMRETGHNVKEEIYLKNIEILSNLMNNTYFEYVKLRLAIRATVNKDVYMSKLTTYEQIKEYLEPFYNFIKQFQRKCIGKSIDFDSVNIWPVLATPYYESSDDGRKLTQIAKIWESVMNNEFLDIPLSRTITLFQGGGSYDKNKPLFVPNTECSELKHSITINYDGSICECSGSYIDNYPLYQQELVQNKEEHLYNVATAHSKMVNYNPITEPEIIDNKKWYVHDGGYRNTNFTYLTSIIMIAEELALSGQISAVYLYDKEKLLRHSMMLLNNSCSRNNIAQTFSPYIKPIEEIRRYFNGILEHIDDMNTITLKNQEGLGSIYGL